MGRHASRHNGTMTRRDDPLLTPFRLRDLELRNRIVMSPMTRCFSPGGIPGQNVADYYARRARSNVGLIITEGTGIDHPAALGAGSMDEQNVPVLHGEAALAGWKRVVDAVHAADGLIFPQLWHMGPIRQANTGPTPQAPSCRPSGLWGPSNGLAGMPPAYLSKMRAPTQAMTESDITDVIDAFGRSAANAKASGFDGIAIHGAHGYLIDSFFWGETNRRTDRWGVTWPSARASARKSSAPSGVPSDRGCRSCFASHNGNCRITAGTWSAPRGSSNPCCDL